MCNINFPVVRRYKAELHAVNLIKTPYKVTLNHCLSPSPSDPGVSAMRDEFHCKGTISNLSSSSSSLYTSMGWATYGPFQASFQCPSVFLTFLCILVYKFLVLAFCAHGLCSLICMHLIPR